MKNKNQDNYDLPLIILENERSRIAKELHDETIQDLIHTIHQTELISHYMDQDPIKARLELSLLSKNLKKSIANTRNIIYDLRPMAINDLGLSGAIEEYFIYLKGISDIDFVYEAEDNLVHLKDDEILNIFRIIQEACNNAIKHSCSKTVRINIERNQEDSYLITIDDDGIGCKKEDMDKMNHYGLKILKERVTMISGECKIFTEPNKGFHIRVIVPITC